MTVASYRTRRRRRGIKERTENLLQELKNPDDNMVDNDKHDPP
jgi:hypothetical protein